MKAGRALDALVAENVMGWVMARRTDDGTWADWGSAPNKPPKENSLAWMCAVPHYSTDITAAWTVIERLIAQKLWTQFTLIEHEGQWKVWDYHFGPEEDKYQDYLAAAPTAPLAICLAALQAVGTQQPVEAA